MSAPLQSVRACSDKIARWCILGVQGALLHQFLEERIHVNSLTTACTSLPAKQSATQALSALERAILGEPVPVSCCKKDHATPWWASTMRGHDILSNQTWVSLENLQPMRELYWHPLRSPVMT